MQACSRKTAGLLIVVAVAAAIWPTRVAAQSNDCSTAPLLDPTVAAWNFTTPSTTYQCSDGTDKCMVWRINTPTTITNWGMTTCGYLDDTSLILRTGPCTANNHFGDTSLGVYNRDGCGASALLYGLTLNAGQDYYLMLGLPSALPASGVVGKGSNLCVAGTTDHDITTNPTYHLSTPCVTCSPGQYVPAGLTGPCSNFNCSIGSVDHDSNPATACLVAGPGNDTTSSGLHGPIANFKVVAGRYDHDSNSSTPSIACPAGNYAPVGSTTCTPCSAGTWDHDGSSATACVACTACTLGSTYVSTTCTATDDTVCSTCATCGQGSFASPACTLTANAGCANCTSIPSCTTTGLTCSSNADQQCNLCQAGNYVTPEGTCAPCTACGSNSYQTSGCDGVVDRVCSGCVLCTAGQYQSVDCSPTTNRVCPACSEVPGCTTGLRCTNSMDSTCIDCSSCPHGQYVNATCTNVLDRVCHNCTALPGCPASYTVCSAYGTSTCTAPEESSSMPVYIPIVAAIGGLLLILLLAFVLARRRTRKPATVVAISHEDITMMTINTLAINPANRRASQYETLNGTRGGGDSAVYDTLDAVGSHGGYAVLSKPDAIVPPRSRKPVISSDLSSTSGPQHKMVDTDEYETVGHAAQRETPTDMDQYATVDHSAKQAGVMASEGYQTPGAAPQYDPDSKPESTRDVVYTAADFS
ncbi:hypothetical protein CAOG_006289 [Capsaspora owczarzaki ATCC 30864]|uniref:TNFR-Cys domain-containing protein n=2 Tax=Capsaspora owczarzaki (strain ATCC 30864) TaxID=595528 RepID=A0A0D2WTN2_CAPO3|nr:hypothetical protein CAOG_006289 [Capsaspora owczarzaki ATCC 30864]